MPVNFDDTIAAIATPMGEGGIGIVRVSGKNAIGVVGPLFRPKRQQTNLKSVASHTLHFGDFVNTKEEIQDRVLVSVFRGPHSYTGEDVVEISAHGGMKLVRNILSAILNNGAREAEPGEFTRRAFINGRMDLTQAEAVLDLIRAKTDRSAEAALAQLRGRLSSRINDIKNRLVHLLAHAEAYIDFPEEHVEVYSNDEIKIQFRQVMSALQALLHTYSQGQILREGALVVIVGRTNVGKSSLMNVLLETDRALVSDVPGTTRDTIEESLEVGGYWVRLVDTAGWMESRDELDRAAMERTRRCVKDGKLFLWVIDTSCELQQSDLQILEQLKGKTVLVVANKIDLVSNHEVGKIEKRFASLPICFVSASTRSGLSNLKATIQKMVEQNDLGDEQILITRDRHQRALERALNTLQNGLQAFENGKSLEFIALDLRTALDALKEMVGEIYSEDLLDVIFGEFCIGK